MAGGERGDRCVLVCARSVRVRGKPPQQRWWCGGFEQEREREGERDGLRKIRRRQLRKATVVVLGCRGGREEI